MSKRVEEAAKAFHNQALSDAQEYARMHGGSLTEEVSYGRGLKAGFIKGYEQAEKDLIPLINRLCEAILFEWEDIAELAWKIQSKIKNETK